MSLYKILTLAPLEAFFADDLICNLLNLGFDLKDEKYVGLYFILGGIKVVGGIEGGCASIATGYFGIEIGFAGLEAGCEL